MILLALHFPSFYIIFINFLHFIYLSIPRRLIFFTSFWNLIAQNVLLNLQYVCVCAAATLNIFFLMMTEVFNFMSRLRLFDSSNSYIYDASQEIDIVSNGGVSEKISEWVSNC